MAQTLEEGISEEQPDLLPAMTVDGSVQGIDPRIYGGKGLPEELLFDFDQPALTQEGSPIPVELSFQNLAALREGQAAIEEANREPAGYGEAFWAGVASTDTAAALEYLTSPDFEIDPQFKFSEAFETLPIVVEGKEFDFLKKSKSGAEFSWRLNRLQTIREATKAMGDHPLVGMLPLVVDPAYIAADLATIGATKALRLGRIASGLSTAAGATGVMAVAGEGRPVEASEYISNALINGAAGAVVYSGRDILPADTLFPAKALLNAAKGTNVPANVSEKIGEALQWNIRKTFTNMGPGGKRAADILFDNNSDLTKITVESQRRAIRQELTVLQKDFEDTLLARMREDGTGIFSRIRSSRRGIQHQNAILKEVKEELLRQEQLDRAGMPITRGTASDSVWDMADKVNKLHEKALDILKNTGVEGAAGLEARKGFFHRVWSVDSMENMQKAIRRAAPNLTDEQALTHIRVLLSRSLQSANGWAAELANDVGNAIVSRTFNKGYLEDGAFAANVSVGNIAQLRDILKNEGLSNDRINRAISGIQKSTEDISKPAYMKHRVNLDYNTSITVGGQDFRVVDLIDNNLTTVIDRYLDGVAGKAAFTRAGLGKAEDINKLRAAVVGDVQSNLRDRTGEMFDNTVAWLSGQPAGAAMNTFMRTNAAYGRMLALGSAAIWQTTEYASIFQKYGFMRATAAFIKEFPGFRKIWNDVQSNPAMAKRLNNVLSERSEADIRLRPYITRFEDNYEFGIGQTVQLAVQQAEQLVPFVNTMKYVHSHQARMTARLITDMVDRAAQGDANSVRILSKYGLKSDLYDRMRTDIRTHGLSVDKWSDEVWADVRPVFSKMMDEGALFSRLGDMPYFAMFDPVGKFLFTYRSFVLTAHNKLLAGTIARDGVGAATLLMLYQFPLSMMAVQAQSVVSGKGPLSLEEAATKGVGQMGGLGLFTEPWDIIFGQNPRFGTPGLIPIDRAYRLGSEIASGDLKGSAVGAMNMVPLLGLIQPLKSLQTLAKED